MTSTHTHTDTDTDTYDELAGPALDPALWMPLDLGSGRCLEPGASTTVADGVVTIEIPRFTRSDPSSQMVDNSKHVLLSTRGFRLPDDGVAHFSAEVSAEVSGGAGDYRHGFAAFNLADATGGTGMAFDILSTGDRVLAEHEVLPLPGQEHPFTRVVEDPFFLSRAGAAAAGFHRCSFEVDRSRGQVVYRVDDRVLHVAAGLTGMPEEVHLVVGFFTLLPVGGGVSSAHGQGARASWRDVRVSLA